MTGRLAADATPGAGRMNAVAIGVVLVLRPQLAVLADLDEAAAIIVIVIMFGCLVFHVLFNFSCN